MLVVFSSTARRDLIEIASFIATDSPSRAKTFIDELAAACEGLSDQPERFALIRGYEGKGYRSRPYGSYAIVYGVEQDHVRVLRVLHGARNLREIFGN